jgi:hypothetical protein
MAAEQLGGAQPAAGVPVIIEASLPDLLKGVEAESDDLGGRGQWIIRKKRSSKARPRLNFEVFMETDVGAKRKRAPKKDTLYEYN